MEIIRTIDIPGNSDEYIVLTEKECREREEGLTPCAAEIRIELTEEEKKSIYAEMHAKELIEQAEEAIYEHFEVVMFDRAGLVKRMDRAGLDVRLEMDPNNYKSLISRVIRDFTSSQARSLLVHNVWEKLIAFELKKKDRSKDDTDF